MSAPLESVKACRRHLFDEVERVKPRAIVVLGSSAYSMLGDLPPFEVARGKLMQLHDVPCMPTHHPAALLRKPALKAEAWKDLQAVQKLLS
jgi:DNA polymerase